MYRFGVIGELLGMIWRRRMWVLLPPLIALTVVAALIILAQATPLGPLIYPLF